MTTSRSALFALLLVLGTSLFAGNVAHAEDASDEIVIGAIPPLTGEHILDGQTQKKALELAVSEVNARGGINGKKLKLVLVDNQSTEKGALDAYAKLFAEHKPVAAIIGNKSFQVLALNGEINKMAVPSLTGATAPKVTLQGNPWIFRVRAADTITAKAMLTYVRDDLKHTKIGILNSNDAFGLSGRDLLEKFAKELKLTVAHKVTFAVGDRDFSTHLKAFKDAGIEILCVYGSGSSDVGIFQRQYSEFKPGFKYIGSPSSQYRGTLKISQEKSEGVFAMSDFVAGNREVALDYIEAYKQKYNEAIDPGAIWAYDAVKLIALAAKDRKSTPKDIRDGLLAIKSYEGVLGTFSFQPNGDGLHQVAVVKIEKLEPKLLKITAPSK